MIKYGILTLFFKVAIPTMYNMYLSWIKPCVVVQDILPNLSDFLRSEFQG